MSIPQILIVGAGPSGLILALALLKSGVSVRIIEKDLQHHVGTRGPGIQPRTLEAEYFLGVLDDPRKIARPTPVLNIYDPSDAHHVVKSARIVQEVDQTPAFPITKPLLLGQFRHQAVLRKHVEALGGQIELGTMLVGLEQNVNGVIADISKMTGGVEVREKAHFSYIVGTDGARSTVRKCLGINFVGETREEEKMYIADVKLKGLEEKDLHLWGDTHRASVCLNYTGQPFSFQMILAGPNVDFVSLSSNKDKETLQSELDRISHRTDMKLIDVSWQSEWRPNIRMAECFRVGRVFIAGDAAHAHSPNGGQGLNSSIQDAFNLSWKLALVMKDYGNAHLLDSYEMERLPVIAEMLNISTALHSKAFRSDTKKAVQEAQSQGHSRNEDEAWYRGWKLFQLDLNYRWSTVVMDDRFENTTEEKNAYGAEGHDIRAGDRAPDAPGLLVLHQTVEGVKKTRLFEIFDPTLHTMLVFYPLSSNERTHAEVQAALSITRSLRPGHVRISLVMKGGQPEERVSFPGIDYLVRDDRGHAFAGYGVKGDAIIFVVVRPDGVIGAFVSGAGGIERYFSNVFRL